jgi:anthranilate synthase component 2
MNLLIVDNNDSFTYNLVQMVEETGLAEVDVKNHAKISLNQIADYDKVLFSPGPSLPDDFPIMKRILSAHGAQKSILGICMGMQAIAEFFGADLHNLRVPVHGQKRQLKIIKHDPIFNNIHNNTKIGLYHSWAVLPESIPTEIELLATDENGVIMALRHKNLDIKGLQFHPESIITSQGKLIIENWLMKNS